MESDKLLKNSSLMDAIRYFSDSMVCLETVSKAKWPKGPECPKCGGKKVSFIKTRMLWTCLKCRKQFSVKVGTIFEDSAIPLDKWLVAMWLIANCKNGISSYELSPSPIQRTARVTETQTDSPLPHNDGPSPGSRLAMFELTALRGIMCRRTRRMRAVSRSV